MSKSFIDVYYFFDEQEWMRASEPVSIASEFNRSMHSVSGASLCPAVTDAQRNLFGIRSLYDFSFSVDDSGVVTSISSDDQFAKRHLVVRSTEARSYGFTPHLYLYADCPSLIARIGVSPYLEDNEVAKRCSIIEGQFDIARWLRPIDFAFSLRKGYEEFVVKEGEIYQYVQFLTDRKIKFHRVMPSPELTALGEASIRTTFKTNIRRRLADYYKIGPKQSKVIEIFKKNLI